jgi:hypothetical protein
VVDPSVAQGLDNGEVGVGEIDVLADHGDLDGLRRRLDPFHKGAPLGEIRLAVGHPQVTHEVSVQALVVEHQRDLVDRSGVGLRDHALEIDVAEQRDLLLEAPAYVPVGAADDHVGVDTYRPELAHGVLRRLGLQLTGGADVRQERYVNERAVVAADLVAELADGFQERQRLDVTDGPADLHYEQVGPAGHRESLYTALDLIGDVRDDLDGLAQELAPTFLGDDCLVDAAGGGVRAAVEILVGEPLVVAQIQVGLRAVVEHEDLAVLERVHRARVDVDVRIELLDGDAEAVSLEEAAERGGGDSLPEAGGDPSGDE